MKTDWRRLVLLAGLLLLVVWAAPLAPAPARAETAVPAGCIEGEQPGGALYRICMPGFFNPVWNGELLLYAHGYVAVTEPLAIPSEAALIAPLVNASGYGFATSSYRENGLAVLPGVQDMLELVDIFTAAYGAPDRIYLMGFSEGGIVTTLSVEQYPQVYAGGLAGCGPIGSFRRHLAYVLDFRLVFDYFFPGLMPGAPLDMPVELIAEWDAHWETVIKPAVTDPANRDRVNQLMAVTEAPFTPGDVQTIYDTIYDVLRYNVIGANDTLARMGGSPFDNRARVYRGSADDAALNAAIPRFTPDPQALAALANYETEGRLQRPLVTIHTTLDAIVPYWHAPLYRAKTLRNDNLALNDLITVERYGHCNFTVPELLSAFDLLVDRVANPVPPQPVTRSYLPVVVLAEE